MIALEMPNCRLYLAPPFQHLPKGPRCHFEAPSSEVNQAKTLTPVNPVSLVHHDVFWFHARKCDLLRMCRVRSVTIEGIAVQGLHSNDSAFAVDENKADLVPKFITLVGLPLGNAFHMGLMNTVKLGRTGPCLLQQPIGSL